MKQTKRHAGPFDQSIRKQILMQKPCNWVCADQTVSNHQRANNKLLFSEGQQSQQHHQLDSRVFPFYWSWAERVRLCFVLYHTFKLGCLHYCEADGEMNADCFWKVLNSEGVKIKHTLPWWVEIVPDFLFFIITWSLYQYRWQLRHSWWDMFVWHIWTYGCPGIVWVVYILSPNVRPHR